jgi:phosphate transport system substrate-binding protein
MATKWMSPLLKPSLLTKLMLFLLLLPATLPYSIGYISLGSLSARVKAINIDGVAPTQKNIADGTYKVARPFNIAVKNEPTGVAKDFIDYIMSAQGQALVADNYIPVATDAQVFTTNRSAGKVVVAGSSSVSPLMEKLAEDYAKMNPNANIELQTSDSTAGMIGTTITIEFPVSNSHFPNREGNYPETRGN